MHDTLSNGNKNYFTRMVYTCTPEQVVRAMLTGSQGIDYDINAYGRDDVEPVPPPRCRKT